MDASQPQLWAQLVPCMDAAPYAGFPRESFPWAMGKIQVQAG